MAHLEITTFIAATPKAVWDFRPPLGRVGEFAFALLARPHLRRVFARSLANLKRLSEAAPKVGRP